VCFDSKFIRSQNTLERSTRKMMWKMLYSNLPRESQNYQKYLDLQIIATGSRFQHTCQIPPSKHYASYAKCTKRKLPTHPSATFHPPKKHSPTSRKRLSCVSYPCLYPAQPSFLFFSFLFFVFPRRRHIEELPCS
jgi:hypothetical protein